MLLTRSLSVEGLYVGRHKASLKYIQSWCCSGGWERCSIKMSLQQGYLHPLACISLTLSSPMPGQDNGSLLYNQCGPFPPFPVRSGPNPRGVLALCFSELGSNCFKWGGLVKHLLSRAVCWGGLDLCPKLLCSAVPDAQQHVGLHVPQVLCVSPWTKSFMAYAALNNARWPNTHLNTCSHTRGDEVKVHQSISRICHLLCHWEALCQAQQQQKRKMGEKIKE